ITLVHGDVAGLAMDILPDAPAEGDLYRYGNAIPAFTWWVENADVSKDDLTVSLVGNYMVNEMEWSPYASGDRKGGTWAWPGAPGIPFTSGAIDFDVTPQAALAGLTVHYEIEIAYNKATYGGSGVLTAQGTIHVVHDWDEGAYTAPTCEAGGYTTYTCRVDGCGDSHTGNATPALGHAWGDWIVTTPATEDAAGVETRVCAHDGSHKEARAIPKLTVYHILEDFGTWSGEGDLTARIDAPYVKFVQLTYGGGVIPASEYDKWEGSTVIRLHENHLTTYPAGTHTLYAEYSDGHSEPITLIVPESAAGGKAGGTSGSSGNATGSGSGSASGSSNADSNTSSSTASTGTTAAAGKDPGSQVKSGSSGLGNGDGIEEALIGGPAGAVDSAANAAGAATQHTVRTIAFILVGVGIAALILLAAKKRRKEEEESP
ncbi:MAG: hypothetical protein LBR44_12450, partial [Clostridiales Family XIII bacterium]|nr:hypothetical protein [Clostridiales Family XIII bacterium]